MGSSFLLRVRDIYMGFYETVNLEKGKVMCKYCDIDKYGECFNFIDELERYITLNGIKVAVVETYILNTSEGNWYLETDMGTFSDAESSSVKKTPISYCPFCGRKLD